MWGAHQHAVLKFVHDLYLFLPHSLYRHVTAFCTDAPSHIEAQARILWLRTLVMGFHTERDILGGVVEQHCATISDE